MDVLALVADLEYLRLEACPFALLADQLHIGQELHLYSDRAVTLAVLTAPASNIEREVAGGEAAFPGFGQGSEQIADAVESLDVGYWIRARCTADGRLIHEDQVIDELCAFKPIPCCRRRLRAIVLLLGRRHRLKQHIVQQTGFA